ncbi:DUF3576 domain-containing protein [Shimia aestuarii]|uniref:DUF3576 domain-containing protein n=1 Tax=Shimia aestuarii TaxID=254406 RepID=A0A1I4MRZ8_9RHOB|nr:DUF3576 domain-containing protein [Shimia aestuarii]SFM06029.1 protein of unknown function [Shimia aestuarii]
MKKSGIFGITVAMVALLTIGACGGRTVVIQGDAEGYLERDDVGNPIENQQITGTKTGSTIWDIFKDDNSDVTVRVNKYLWAASLEVLDFLPIESVDPFSGVISTGYGVPPGGGRSYRATVYIRDPALDARSLNVAMQTRGGGSVNAGTVRAVEDAILTRARQLRIADGKL